MRYRRQGWVRDQTMTPGQRFSSAVDRLQQLSLGMRIGVGAAALAFVAVLVFAISTAGAGDNDPGFVAQPATPTASPTRTPTPTPTPTPPPWPWPSDPVPLGEAAGLVNPSSLNFPAPPPSDRVPPGNTAGIARIVAPALGMDHYVETLGIVNGQMQSPEVDGNHSVGWYATDERWTFGVPGEAGNSVFSAHETWGHMTGPFYQLHQARIGEDVYLEMESGERRHYQVIRVTRYPVADMPMREVLWPSDRPEAEDWITLYTCGGQIIYGPNGYGDYLDRDVLVAKWVGSEFPEGEPGSTPAHGPQEDAPTEEPPAVAPDAPDLSPE